MIEGIKKVSYNVFDLSSSFEYFVAFTALVQKVVFYYKKWLKQIPEVVKYWLHGHMLLGAVAKGFKVFPHKFLKHFELGNTKISLLNHLWDAGAPFGS